MSSEVEEALQRVAQYIEVHESLATTQLTVGKDVAKLKGVVLKLDDLKVVLVSARISEIGVLFHSLAVKERDMARSHEDQMRAALEQLRQELS